MIIVMRMTIIPLGYRFVEINENFTCHVRKFYR